MSSTSKDRLECFRRAKNWRYGVEEDTEINLWQNLCLIILLDMMRFFLVCWIHLYHFLFLFLDFLTLTRCYSYWLNAHFPLLLFDVLGQLFLCLFKKLLLYIILIFFPSVSSSFASFSFSSFLFLLLFIPLHLLLPRPTKPPLPYSRKIWHSRTS